MRRTKLIKNQKSNFNTLVSSLIDSGYERVSVTLSVGEFSVRGDIVDIYSPSNELPIRCEFNGDVVERLTLFNPHNQRSQDDLNQITIAAIDSATKKPEPLTASDIANSIKMGDVVVHEDFGVGRYEGLHLLNLTGQEAEFLWIVYEGGDKVYVPIENCHLVHPYTGSDDNPKLNKLYDGSWKRLRDKAEKAVTLYAQELYELYQKRQTATREPYAEDSDFQQQFEAQFPFKETVDQLRAIAEIKSDLESDQIMDRLLCGDVGYGKTEVLLRAVFKALENHHQVAVLVPTTLLAEQHYETFVDRLNEFPFRVAVLSRFQSKLTQKNILKELQAGTIDLVVGTHRLLQKDVQFSHLGMLVIDEEQRFGVSHKEAIKQMKGDIDVLSVSATPIPRTLYLSLTGAREISCINTPPKARRPVLTKVQAYDEQEIQRRIKRELDRGGQVFYLHNRVQTIDSVGQKVQSWFPEATVDIGHGQLSEDALQKVMMKFWSGETQVLVCSTIIENGLDVPRANTLIVEGAETFGLAQIHQIRGRVGRSTEQGYAYLFYTHEGKLTEKTKKRLLAIQSYTSLGAGYQLALKDLEIRGAGALLGHKQHGHMISVGFDLYCKMLSRAVQHAKDEPIKPMLASKLESKIKAYIPESYVTSDQERLALYQRLMTLNSLTEFDDFIDEIEDRYGKIPKLVEMLLTTVREQLAA